MKRNRVIKSWRITAENELFVRFQGSSNYTCAKVLELTTDENDQPVQIVLDRLIHQHDEQAFERHIDNEWLPTAYVSGCYTSELTFNQLKTIDDNHA